MKVYIKAVVSIENLKTQFGEGINDDMFARLVNVDPTADYDSNRGGKYCPWIFRKYKEGSLTEDDFQNLTDALEHFSKYSKKYQHTDLGQYRTVEEFLQDAEDVANRPLTEKEIAKENKKRSHHTSDVDKEFIVEDDEWEVWRPLTKAGSMALASLGGEKARWCTANDGSDYYWNRYTSQGPLYIFINKADPTEKYQTHFETDSYMYNKYDRPQGETFFYNFCKEHPIIGDYFKVQVVDGLYLRAGHIVRYDKDATVIKIPEGVTELNPRLSFPNGLEELYLPDSITELRPGAFDYQHNLKYVKLPNTLTKLPSDVFSVCENLERIEIPDSVVSYGRHAFYGCVKLKSIKNSSSLERIGEECFKGCRALEDFKLPESLTYLGSRCFVNSSITDISLPDSVTTLRGTFNCDQEISTVDLNNVTEILADTFRESTIDEIDLTKVKRIGASAFRGCPNLSTITLSPGVLVGSNAFADCPNLTKINVPKDCELRYKVFDNCPNLTVTWQKEDEDYEFEDIKLLVCDESCIQLIEANRGIVKIKTRQGKVYDIS